MPLLSLWIVTPSRNGSPSTSAAAAVVAQGYELDVNGWEDAAGMSSLECYKEWQQDKPAYYTGMMLILLFLLHSRVAPCPVWRLLWFQCWEVQHFWVHCA
jgi:hypothetical protein